MYKEDKVKILKSLQNSRHDVRLFTPVIMRIARFCIPNTRRNYLCDTEPQSIMSYTNHDSMSEV